MGKNCERQARVPTLILAYSGGLDTTTAITWLTKERGYDVVALNIDVGMSREQDILEERGLAAGAVRVIIEDAREDFLRYFAFPALAAGALYQDVYPLATALARPLMAKLLVDVAHDQGAVAVAHGCTGKGNDQVRFDVGIRTLDPSLAIVAPTREEAMSREAEIEYLQEHGIAIAWEVKGSFSIDENIWGRSVEAGVLEDPWTVPPPDAYVWTCAPEDAPLAGEDVEIGFEAGFPTTIDGETLSPVALVERLNDLGGRHGVGRVDHVEDRLVGIKSREIYEAPAATILFAAHRALETLTLSRSQIAFKRQIAAEYATLIYDGLWFSAHHQDLAAYTASTQRFVSGTVRLRLHRGSVTVTGRRADASLYDRSLATYDREDSFDQASAVGFIDIWGLQARVQANQQLRDQLSSVLHIAQPQGESTP